MCLPVCAPASVKYVCNVFSPISSWSGAADTEVLFAGAFLRFDDSTLEETFLYAFLEP